MNSWLHAWESVFGLPESTPPLLVATVCICLIFSALVLPAAWLTTFVERKLGADLQARVGPNRAGPGGIFQPLADLLKLLQKSQNAAPAESRGDWLWVGVQTAALYSTLAVLPLGSILMLLDTDLSALLPFWAALVASLATLLLGARSNRVAGWLGGFRVASQAIAGAFPALISLLSAAMSAGGFRWSQIAASQGFSPLFWTIANPFELLAFFVFVISGLVLFAVPPMDAGFSATDLHGGVAARFQGWRLSLFRLGRFYGFFLWSVISVVLFLGAWTLPSAVTESLRDSNAWIPLAALEFLWLFSKTFVLMVVVQWVARTNPRSRVDQITDFAWRILGPFSLIALIGSAIWVGRGAFS